ncbi:MAG: WecB/TagA/CpsF family glycosyltransferase [Flavobacteriales bacterium]
MLVKRRVINVDISMGSFSEHVQAICDLGRTRASGYVCCVNAHMAVEAREPSFNAIVNNADLATADGMPILYSMRWLTGVHAERVAGNDLMPALLLEAERQSLKVFLYGGKQEVLDTIITRAAKEQVRSPIVGHESPPFRQMSIAEMEETASRINASGANIVMVALGCPKQERWMAAMQGKVNAVMLGLGGAFLLYAGVDTRAPKWMRDLSLEWLYRLALEPRRLFKRYFITNSLFLGMFAKALIQRE